MTRFLAAAAILAGLVALPTAALAWQSYASFAETSQGVSFVGVELSSPNAGPRRCELRVAVKYRGAKATPQRFRVEVGLSGGKAAASSFATTAAMGQHVFTVDTAADGCWAADLQRPVRLSVSG